MFNSGKTFFRALGAILLAVAFSATASAQFTQFTGAVSSDYNDPANWVGGVVPAGAGETAVIGQSGIAGAANPAVADVTSSTPTGLFEFSVGEGGGTGTVNHSAGTVGTANWALVGRGGGSVGTYNVSGTADVQVGGGTGGAAASFAAGVSGGTGTINITGGTVNSSGYTFGVDAGSVGVVNQSAGTLNAGQWINVGQAGGADGTYNLSGGTVNTNELSIGENGPVVGTFNATGTGVVNAQVVRVGRNDGSTGTLNITGSNVDFDTDMFSVASSDGSLAVGSSGTVNFISDATDISTIDVTGDVFLNDGLGAGSTAALNIDLSAGDPGGNLLLFDVGGNITGQFTGLAEGALVPGSNGRTITYNYLGAGDIALISAIPEPSSLALLMIAGYGLLRRRRA